MKPESLDAYQFINNKKTFQSAFTGVVRAYKLPYHNSSEIAFLRRGIWGFHIDYCIHGDINSFDRYVIEGMMVSKGAYMALISKLGEALNV